MSDVPVEIVRSARRKKTAQAYATDGRVRVLVPAGLSREDEDRIVKDLVEQVARKMAAREVDLDARAKAVAAAYGLRTPTTIEWSSRQNVRWGSCTPSTGAIRISHRLQSAPDWVLDWVILHELAHLDIPGHGSRFQAVVGRYPLAERAEGYLIAKSEA